MDDKKSPIGKENVQGNMNRRHWLGLAGAAVAGAVLGRASNSIPKDVKTFTLDGRIYNVLSSKEYDLFIDLAMARIAADKTIINKNDVDKLFRTDELIIPEYVIEPLSHSKFEEVSLLGLDEKPYSEEDKAAVIARKIQSDRRLFANTWRWNNLVESAADIFLRTEEGEQYALLLETKPKLALQKILDNVDYISSRDLNVGNLKAQIQDMLSKKDDYLPINQLLDVDVTTVPSKDFPPLRLDDMFSALTGKRYAPTDETAFFMLEMAIKSGRFHNIKNGEENNVAKTYVMKYLFDESVKPESSKFRLQKITRGRRLTSDQSSGQSL